MEGARIIDAADRFIERGTQQGEPTPDTLARVYDLDSYREEHNKIIEDIVKKSASGLAVILESNGYPDEAIELIEGAYKLARSGATAQDIYEIFNQNLKDKHPHLHRAYKL